MDQEGLRKRCWKTVKSSLAMAQHQWRDDLVSNHEYVTGPSNIQQCTDQADRLREAVYSGGGMRSGGLVLQMVLSVAHLWSFWTNQAPTSITFLDRRAAVQLSTFCALGVILFAEHALKSLLQGVNRNSCLEWYLMIVHQNMFITGCFFVASLSMFHEDVLVSHRSFLLKMCWAYLVCNDPYYLPFAWHVVFFSGQGFICWLNFHYHMGFLKPFTIILGVCLVFVELWFFRKAEQSIDSRAALVRELEKEKHARVMGEALKDAFRGLLNVMFDAWCECDTSSRIFAASQHLEQFLGSSDNAYTGSELGGLAATATETKRVIEFLRQTCVVSDSEWSKSAFRPPAVLETVLRRSDASSDQLQSDIPVKLFCVPIPNSNTLEGLETHGGLEHLFIGLQHVQTHECISTSGRLICEPNLTSQGIAHHQGDDFAPVDAKDQADIDADKKLHVANPSDAEFDLHSGSALPLSPLGLEPHAAEPSLISSLAHTWTQFTEPRCIRSSCEIGVQAGMSFFGRMQEIGTQVDASSSPASVQILKIPSLPALGHRRPPRPSGEVSLKRDKVRHRSAQPKRLCHEDFKQTPSQTVVFLISECLPKINDQKYCCFFHSSIISMNNALKSMISGECSSMKFSADKVFQCEQCLALNFEEGNDEDSSTQQVDICEVCGASRLEFAESELLEADDVSQAADISNSAGSQDSDS